MPGLVMDEIRPMLPDLTMKTLLCLERDISEWLQGRDGSQFYFDEWTRFLSDVRAAKAIAVEKPPQGRKN